MPEDTKDRGTRVFEGHHGVYLKDGNINVSKNWKSRRKDGTDYVYNSNSSYPKNRNNVRKVSRDVRKRWGKAKLYWK